MKAISPSHIFSFLRCAIEHTTEMIFWVDADGGIACANRAACQNLGYTLEELGRITWRDVDPHCVEQDLWHAWLANRTEGEAIDSWLVARNGHMFHVASRWSALSAEGQQFYCCFCRDVSNRRRSEGELAFQAQHDQLTGLPNRRLFRTRLQHAVENCETTGKGLALFYIDLDGFKLVNDTLGHGVGDFLLKKVSSRLRGIVRGSDVLARMGGDEFTLIAEGIDLPEQAGVVADKLLGALQRSFSVHGSELRVGASIGVSLFPQTESQDLLQSADAAMYEAKRNGRNCWQLFTSEMQSVARQRLLIENHLRNAVQRNEFSIDFQPEVDLASNRTVRFEALLRWNNPSLGRVSPATFIPIAEECGFICEIGNWVLEEACRITLSDQVAGGPLGGVSVNVSAVQFLRADFVETVATILERTGLPPSYLELELTESLVVKGLDDLVEKIEQLRKIGVTVVIDDFGTGYSSLSYLQKLPVDAIKIDQSFIASLSTNANTYALVSALNSLAASLGIRVLVEGVETEEHLNAVHSIGVAEAQGYFLGVPKPSRESHVQCRSVATCSEPCR